VLCLALLTLSATVQTDAYGNVRPQKFQIKETNGQKQAAPPRGIEKR